MAAISFIVTVKPNEAAFDKLTEKVKELKAVLQEVREIVNSGELIDIVKSEPNETELPHPEWDKMVEIFQNRRNKQHKEVNDEPNQ